MFHAIVCFLLVLSLSRANVQIITMDSNLTERWYGPVANCLIHQSGNRSLYYYLNACENETNSKSLYRDGLYSLYSSTYASKVRGICCTDDIPLSERGFDKAIQGYEDPDSNVVVETLRLLSVHNRTIILMGDSMNNQVYSAFFEEMRRERVMGEIKRFDINELWWGQPDFLQQLGINKKVIAYLELNVWYPMLSASDSEDKRKMHPVYIYRINLWYFSNNFEETLLVTKVIPFLNNVLHPAGLVMIGNIGHHLGFERLPNNHAYLIERMSQFVNFLHQLTVDNNQTIASFRETTPAFFNSPNQDGSFESWERSPNSNYDYRVPNSWDKTLYYCRDIKNITSSNLPENVAVRQILDLWSTSNVHIVSTYKYMAHFGKMKYGNCGGWSRVGVLDCVHFCFFSPPMWMPIWHEIHRVVKKGSQSISESTVLSANISMIYSIKETSKLFLFHNGVIRPIASISSDDTSYGVNLSMLPVKQVSPDFLASYPLGLAPPTLHFRNGDVIKGSDRAIYLISDGKKRVFPNWDTFVAMHYDLSMVKHVSDDELNAIPTGSELPPLNRR